MSKRDYINVASFTYIPCISDIGDLHLAKVLLLFLHTVNLLSWFALSNLGWVSRSQNLSITACLEHPPACFSVFFTNNMLKRGVQFKFSCAMFLKRLKEICLYSKFLATVFQSKLRSQLFRQPYQKSRNSVSKKHYDIVFN